MKQALSSALLLCGVLSACGGGGGAGGGSSNLGGNTGIVLPPVASGSDPLYSRQWHLKNTGQESALPGTDINVESVWQQGNEGQGVAVAVVDDGLELAHEDLRDRVMPGQSLNLAANGLPANDPSPQSDSDDHGTAVAGLIAASRNTLGGRGVAPRASLLAANLLAAPPSDHTEATALLHGQQVVAISNNSWGSSDEDSELSYNGPLARAAITQGATSGRGGLGIVYLFAAGNGAVRQQPDYTVMTTGQRSVYDAYNNHPFIINVGALRADGTPSEYSEPGANVLVSAPSDSYILNLPGLYTTALTGSYLGMSYLGQYWTYGNYRPDFGGTSGATPIVAGVVALMLSARPQLSWRDVRWILATTARPVNNSPESGSAAMGRGIYSHKTGFGLVDAQAAVNQALSHSPLPPMKTCTLDMVGASNAAAPDGNGEVQISVNTGSCDITRLETAELVLSATANPGSSTIMLSSPQARVSTLATPHSCFSRNAADYYVATSCSVKYTDWRFQSVRHMGENPAGDWTLRLSGLNAGDRVSNVQLVLRGV